MRRYQVHTHLTTDEHAIVRRAAEKHGETVSSYLRRLGLTDAKAVLGEQPPAADPWLARAREAVENG